MSKFQNSFLYQRCFCLDLFHSCFAADKCAADFMALFCQQKCRQNIKLVKLYMLLGTSCRLDLQYLCLPQTRLSLIKLLQHQVRALEVFCVSNFVLTEIRQPIHLHWLTHFDWIFYKCGFFAKLSPSPAQLEFSLGLLVSWS